MKKKTISIKFTKDELLELDDAIDCVSGDIEKVINKIFGGLEDYAKKYKEDITNIYRRFM